MMVFWLNMHAGFVVGVGMLGLHGIERFVLSWYRGRDLRKAWHECWHLA